MSSFRNKLQRPTILTFLKERVFYKGMGKIYHILHLCKNFLSQKTVMCTKLPVQNILFSTLIIDLKFRQNENKEILEEPGERIESQVNIVWLPSLPPCFQVSTGQGGTAWTSYKWTSTDKG